MAIACVALIALAVVSGAIYEAVGVRAAARDSCDAGSRGTRGVQVKTEAFEELLTGIRQLGEIRRAAATAAP